MSKHMSDKGWQYHHRIAVECYSIWAKDNFKTRKEERFFYFLMIDSQKEAFKIEQMYNF
jgi:hypothetical protein